MNLAVILLNSLWSGLFAAGLAVLLTAPSRYVPTTLICGFGGRLARDVLASWGLSQNWSTVVAVMLVVVVAVAMIRRLTVSPVVLICAILPLGAAVAMFNLIFALMQISSAKGEALGLASAALTVNLAKVFVTSLAIAIGLGAGMAIVRLFRRDGAVAD